MNEQEFLEYLDSLTDEDFERLIEDKDCVGKAVSHELKKHPDMKRDQAIAIAHSKCGKSKSDSVAWFAEDSQFGTVNKLNNVLKIPVILAREMIQSYQDSKHFKPYDELKKAIAGLEDLPVIIEHKQWTDDDIVGYVREFRADDKDRSIKGVAYLTESLLPEAIADTLKKNITVPISIGFWADIGEGGKFKDEVYDHTQRDIALNHLAICIRSIARCPPNQCGLNLDSLKSPELDGEILIKKGNYYYYINKEENENITKIQEIGDNMGDIRNFPTDQKSIDVDVNNPTSTAPSGMLASTGKDILSVLSKLIDFTGYISKPSIRKDAEDLLLTLITKIKDGEKMGDNNDLTKELESRIKNLEDSIKEKDKKISEFEEKERKILIDSITKFAVFKDNKFEDICLHDLEVMADTASKFDPSMAKAKVLPKTKQTSTNIEDSRMSPYVFDREPFKEDE